MCPKFGIQAFRGAPCQPRRALPPVPGSILRRSPRPQPADPGQSPRGWSPRACGASLGCRRSCLAGKQKFNNSENAPRDSWRWKLRRDPASPREVWSGRNALKDGCAEILEASEKRFSGLGDAPRPFGNSSQERHGCWFRDNQRRRANSPSPPPQKRARSRIQILAGATRVSPTATGALFPPGVRQPASPQPAGAECHHSLLCCAVS